MSNPAWPTAPLSKLTSRIGDGIHGTPVYSENGGYPFVNGNNLKCGSIKITNDTKRVSRDEYEKYFIEFDDKTLLLSINGTLGNLAKYQGEEMILGKSAAYIKCTDIDIDFLYYYFQLKEVKSLMWNVATGSTIKNLSLASIRNMEIPTPPGNIAKKIADVLLAIDKKIELNHRINAELEAMAKTLYDYWFVQFDFPDSKGKPYKTSGGKMVFSPNLKREIPEGWDVEPLSKHLDCNRMKLGKKHDLKSLNYLDTANLTNNKVGSIQKLVVGVDTIPSRANMLVSKNDFLYSTVRPNQLHYGIIKSPVENMVASTGFAVLSHKKNPGLNVIFYLHVTSSQNTNKLIRISESSKSSYPSISPADILSLEIVLPSDPKILTRFCELLNPLFEKASEVQKENKDLESLRDWLLPMLMNGQVTVK